MKLSETLEHVYAAMEGSEPAMDYSTRHGVNSAAVLTITDDETAAMVAEYVAERIAGKTVVEIGGGIGLLSMHLGQYARRVYCIEAQPAWTWAFVGVLYAVKPRNVSYLFGTADEFLGAIKGDVALFCTHSDVTGMRLVAQQFAPTVIDVWSELIERHPEAFNPDAVALRAAT